MKNRDVIPAVVLEFFHEWRKEPVCLDTEVAPLGFDSLSLLELVLHVEEKCGCEIPDDALSFKLKGVRVTDIVRKLHEVAVFPEETNQTKETKG